jgi:hypothetical protein
MRRLINQILPFMFIGVAVVAFAFGIMLLAYLFFFGAIVGMILFLFNWIRQKFFATKKMIKTKKKPGRIIDSDNWTKL